MSLFPIPLYARMELGEDRPLTLGKSQFRCTHGLPETGEYLTTMIIMCDLCLLTDLS